jgi:phage gp45-like
VCGESSLSLKRDGTIEIKGSHLKLTGSELIKADCKNAVLDAGEAITAKATRVTVTGSDNVHLDGAGAKLDLTKATTTLSGEAVEIKGRSVALN